MTTQTAFRLKEETLAKLRDKAKDGRPMVWHVEKALSRYLFVDDTIKVPIKKTDVWRDFYRAYPERLRGGSDAHAWKVAKSEHLTDKDFLAMYVDILERGKSKYCPGITKYIREKRWLTPLPTPPEGANGRQQFELDGDAIFEGLDPKVSAQLFPENDHNSHSLEASSDGGGGRAVGERVPKAAPNGFCGDGHKQ